MLETDVGIIVFLQPETNSFVTELIMALQLFRESYDGLFGFTVMLLKSEQELKGFPTFDEDEELHLPKETTEAGIETDVNFVLQKAPYPMLVTELGISMEVKPVCENPYMAMSVTEFGIIIDVKPEHSSNALYPICVTELGITVFMHPSIKVFEDVSIIALQPPRES